MVEGGSLENCCIREGTVGSNPTPTANIYASRCHNEKILSPHPENTLRGEKYLVQVVPDKTHPLEQD